MRIKKFNQIEQNEKSIKEDVEHTSAYGKDIDTLYSKLEPDEDVKLTDHSDKLRGDVVKKKDYLISMLKDAMDKQDWGTIGDAISYIKNRM
jgi:hypothetical protein